jgi:hypothetical protein
MIPFHSILPEIAAAEVRCIRTESSPDGPPADEYAFLEYYCEDLNCDCRRVFFEVVGKSQPRKPLASINYGWESLAFYREKMPWDPDDAKGVVKGELDPLNPQSDFSGFFLDMFRTVVLDEEYRARLKRHHQLFRAELER